MKRTVTVDGRWVGVLFLAAVLLLCWALDEHQRASELEYELREAEKTLGVIAADVERFGHEDWRRVVRDLRLHAGAP